MAFFNNFLKKRWKIYSCHVMRLPCVQTTTLSSIDKIGFTGLVIFWVFFSFLFVRILKVPAQPWRIGNGPGLVNWTSFFRLFLQDFVHFFIFLLGPSVTAARWIYYILSWPSLSVLSTCVQQICSARVAAAKTHQVLTKSTKMGVKVYPLELLVSLGGSPCTTWLNCSKMEFHLGYGNFPVEISINVIPRDHTSDLIS